MSKSSVLSGKSFRSFSVNDDLIAKMVEAVKEGDSKARSTGKVQSFEVFSEGFRTHIVVGRLMIIPAKIIDSPEDFPIALMYGRVVRMINPEDIADMEMHKIGETEFDEFSKKDWARVKDQLFKNDKDKVASLIVFLPAWSNPREFISFHYTKDEAKLAELLAHQVFACYFDPRLSSAFDAILTDVDTFTLDVTDISTKLNFPFLAEGNEKEFPNMEPGDADGKNGGQTAQKRGSFKKKIIVLAADTAGELLEEGEKEVIASLDSALLAAMGSKLASTCSACGHNSDDSMPQGFCESCLKDRKERKKQSADDNDPRMLMGLLFGKNFTSDDNKVFRHPKLGNVWLNDDGSWDHETPSGEYIAGGSGHNELKEHIKDQSVDPTTGKRIGSRKKAEEISCPQCDTGNFDPTQQSCPNCGWNKSTTKKADGIGPDISEAKSETVSPDTIDADIKQLTDTLCEAAGVTASADAWVTDRDEKGEPKAPKAAATAAPVLQEDAIYLERPKDTPIAGEHLLTKVEGDSIFYTCPQQPQMEMKSPGVPKRCPICRAINPVEMGKTEGNDPNPVTAAMTTEERKKLKDLEQIEDDKAEAKHGSKAAAGDEGYRERTPEQDALIDATHGEKGKRIRQFREERGWEINPVWVDSTQAKYPMPCPECRATLKDGTEYNKHITEHFYEVPNVEERWKPSSKHGSATIGVPPVNDETLEAVPGQPHEVPEISEAHNMVEGVEQAEKHDGNAVPAPDAEPMDLNKTAENWSISDVKPNDNNNDAVDAGLKRLEASGDDHLDDLTANGLSVKKDAGGHKPGCVCGFCKNKGTGFGEKKDNDEKDGKKNAAIDNLTAAPIVEAGPETDIHKWIVEHAGDFETATELAESAAQTFDIYEGSEFVIPEQIFEWAGEAKFGSQKKAFKPKGRNCDNCEHYLGEDEFTARGGWSYKCSSCGFKYNHGSSLTVDQQIEKFNDQYHTREASQKVSRHMGKCEECGKERSLSDANLCPQCEKKHEASNIVAAAIAEDRTVNDHISSRKFQSKHDKREARLQNLRKEAGVPLTEDSIWDSITTDFGPAPQVQLPGAGGEQKTPDSGNEDGLKTKLPKGSEESAAKPFTEQETGDAVKIDKGDNTTPKKEAPKAEVKKTEPKKEAPKAEKKEESKEAAAAGPICTCGHLDTDHKPGLTKQSWLGCKKCKQCTGYQKNASVKKANTLTQQMNEFSDLSGAPQAVAGTPVVNAATMLGGPIHNTSEPQNAIAIKDALQTRAEQEIGMSISEKAQNVADEVHADDVAHQDMAETLPKSQTVEVGKSDGGKIVININAKAKKTADEAVVAAPAPIIPIDVEDDEPRKSRTLPSELQEAVQALTDIKTILEENFSGDGSDSEHESLVEEFDNLHTKVVKLINNIAIRKYGSEQLPQIKNAVVAVAKAAGAEYDPETKSYSHPDKCVNCKGTGQVSAPPAARSTTFQPVGKCSECGGSGKKKASKTAGKFSLYTGPTIVHQTAEKLRNAGINVTIEGTEHVHFLADGDSQEVTLQLRDILGPQWGVPVGGVHQLASGVGMCDCGKPATRGSDWVNCDECDKKYKQQHPVKHQPGFPVRPPSLHDVKNEGGLSHRGSKLAVVSPDAINVITTQNMGQNHNPSRPIMAPSHETNMAEESLPQTTEADGASQIHSDSASESNEDATTTVIAASSHHPKDEFEGHGFVFDHYGCDHNEELGIDEDEASEEDLAKMESEDAYSYKHPKGDTGGFSQDEGNWWLIAKTGKPVADGSLHDNSLEKTLNKFFGSFKPTPEFRKNNSTKTSADEGTCPECSHEFSQCQCPNIKEAGFNFFFPGQALREFFPGLQHDMVDYPNDNNTGMIDPAISGGELAAPGDMTSGDLQLEEANLPPDLLFPVEPDEPLNVVTAFDGHSDFTNDPGVSTSPAGGIGIGRDGKPQVLDGAPLRQEDDIRGPMFTDEFYQNSVGVPGQFLASFKQAFLEIHQGLDARKTLATKRAGIDDKGQLADFLKRVVGEIAATFVSAFKVTNRGVVLNRIPGTGEVKLDFVEQGSGIGLSSFATVTGSRIKALLEKMNDDIIQECIDEAKAQAAVWADGTGGFTYEIFCRAESIDKDTLVMKYTFVTGTKG